MMGKGSKRRPRAISAAELDKRWSATFGEKDRAGYELVWSDDALDIDAAIRRLERDRARRAAMCAAMFPLLRVPKWLRVPK